MLENIIQSVGYMEPGFMTGNYVKNMMGLMSVDANDEDIFKNLVDKVNKTIECQILFLVPSHEE